MKEAISIHNLSKRYGDFNLDNFSLEIAPGHVAGLVGSNGAGKTTVIKSLFAAYKPDTGIVRVFGQPMSFGEEDHSSLKARMGFVFDTAPYGPIKVSAVEAIGRANYTNFDVKRFQDEIAAAGIDKDAKSNKLSRGMSMRLQLAFAFAHHPDILILDEPTAGLDPMASQDVLEMFRTFMDDPQHTILISSHDTQDLEAIVDTVTCIHEGETVFSETLDYLQTHYGIVQLPKKEAALVVQQIREAQATQRELVGSDSKREAQDTSEKNADSLEIYTENYALNTTVLVTNIAAAERILGRSITFERPHIDQIMNLMIRGRE